MAKAIQLQAEGQPIFINFQFQQYFVYLNSDYGFNSTMKDWKAIVQNNYISADANLVLSYQEVSSQDLAHMLDKNQFLNNLRILNLKGNKVCPGGIAKLADLEFNKLSELYLEWNQIGSEGVKHLMNCELQSLIVLSLSKNYRYFDGNKIGTEGAKYLANGKCENLASLCLKNNEIDATGVKYIMSHGNLRRLERLWLDGNKINAQGVKYVGVGSSQNFSRIWLYDSKIKQKNCIQLRKLFKQNDRVKLYL